MNEVRKEPRYDTLTCDIGAMREMVMTELGTFVLDSKDVDRECRIKAAEVFLKYAEKRTTELQRKIEEVTNQLKDYKPLIERH